MGLGYLLVAALSVFVTIFALQNTDPASVRFLLWRLETVPVAILVLTALGAGLVIAGLPLGIKLGVWRSRARTLETRARMLETAVGERDRHILKLPREKA